MSIEEVLNKQGDNFCIFDEKFALKKESDSVLRGVYPLQIHEAQKVTYGGEVITQSVLAAWETIEDPSFSLHSMHSYFLKGGSNKSVMRYEVELASTGKNFVNKMVKVFQEHTNELVFTLMASFTRNNYISTKKLAYASGETKRVPFEFQTKTHELLELYKNDLDSLLSITHTGELITNLLPFDSGPDALDEDRKIQVGDREAAFFTRLNDSSKASKNLDKFKVLGLLFLSDSMHLSLLCRAIGLKLNKQNATFWRASLDHSVFIHDLDFDPSQWLFVSYKFPRLSSGRVLIAAQVYNLEGILVATITQEALVDLSLSMVEQANGGSYKL